MRFMTVTVATLLFALSVSCSVTEPAGRDEGTTAESVGASTVVAAKVCSCNPAPDSVNGWVLAKNADGTNKSNCGRCTTSSLCSTGFCYYVNSVGSEQNVGCQFASSTIPIDPADPVDPVDPVPTAPAN